MTPFIYILICASLTSCSAINQKMGMSDDWWGEELLEKVIEEETYMDIDLTPASTEESLSFELFKF